MTEHKTEILAALKFARTLLRKPHGWGKGSNLSAYWDPEKDIIRHCYCLEGAISMGATCGITAYDTAHPTYRRTVNAVRRVLPKKVRYLHEFNDAKKTTKKDVLAVLDATIASLS